MPPWCARRCFTSGAGFVHVTMHITRVQTSLRYPSTNSAMVVRFHCCTLCELPSPLKLLHGVILAFHLPIFLMYPSSSGGLFPLHNACSFGHVEVVSTLLQHKANPSARDSWNFTPLHEAASKGRVDVCISELFACLQVFRMCVCVCVHVCVCVCVCMCVCVCVCGWGVYVFQMLVHYMWTS